MKGGDPTLNGRRGRALCLASLAQTTELLSARTLRFQVQSALGGSLVPLWRLCLFVPCPGTLAAQSMGWPVHRVWTAEGRSSLKHR